jgi:DNA-binding NtrC family response regulator
LIGADISVESTPQRGTTFTLRIRSGREGVDTRGDTNDVADTSALKGRTVFLVDDEVDILRSTQQLLGAWGMHTKTADGVESAKQLFVAGGTPDLFITDLRLRGGESGASLAVDLRKTYGCFPVLVITGEISAAAAADVEALGAALLYKPITPELLAREITRAIASTENP